MQSFFGRYLPGNSFVHKMDPRVKIIMNFIIIVLTFISSYFLTTTLLLVPVVLLYSIANKKIKPLFATLKMPILIGIFVFLLNIYTMREVEDLNILLWLQKEGQYGDKVRYVISQENLTQTAALILRIYIMILATTLLTNTTKPILLTKALEDLMIPLKLLFIPVHIIAMIISLALRFIPTLLDESKRIMKAQATRGVDYKNGRLKEKIRSFTTLVIPLFVASFAKAEDLSNAMETRGYDPYAKRTRYRKLFFTWRDAICLLYVILILTFIILTQMVHIIPLPQWYLITKF